MNPRLASAAKVAGAWMAFVLAALLLSAATHSCSPAKGVPRETARAVVLGVAEAVRMADMSCATAAIAIGATDRTKGRELAEGCAAAYDVARPAVMAAASAVDAWDDGDRRGVLCGLATAGGALQQIAAAVRAAGAALPPVVEDGLRLVGALGVCS